MANNRPSIPAVIKRAVLVEAGHRCAIPTCRFPTTELAHIIPYSEVLNHSYENLIALCPNCHTRYDKGEIDRKSMVIYKKKLVFLSDRFSRYELNLLDHLKSTSKATVFGMLSIKNLLDEELLSITQTLASTVYSDGTTEMTEFIVMLTPKGNEYLNKWIDTNNDEQTYDD